MSIKSAPADRSALVLFSGGQDSTVCLAWALNHFERVETIGFDYGQRHVVELEARLKVLRRLKLEYTPAKHRLGEDHCIDIRGFGAVAESSLTRDAELKMGEKGLPNSFVPGRNLVFFVYAAALADRRDINHLIGGMCETDYSGYPDCRKVTLDSMQDSLRLGIERPYEIHTPLMYINKAQTWAMTAELGGAGLIDIVRHDTHTCYQGDRVHKQDWGYGCGECPACQLRSTGFAHWREMTDVGKLK